MKSTSATKRKQLVFCSMLEFEKTYLPKSFEKRFVEKPSGAQEIGTSLAKDSLQKIKKQLA